jgi:alpha-1,2-mannosyltransferase
VWDVVDLLAVAALIAVSVAAARCRQVTSSDWRTGLILLAPVGLLLWPFRSDLDLGQINVVLVLMIVSDLTVGWSVRGRRLPTGLLVGLAAAIKLTPLIFVPYLVVTRQWRAARNAALTFAVATGAMFAVAPRSSWLYFTKDAWDVKRVGNAHSLGNQTLVVAFQRAHFPLPASLFDLAALGVLCGGLTVAAVAYRRSSAMLGLLACAATGLLISPISWDHHYVWILPGLIWLVVGKDRPTKGSLWAVAASVVFMVIPPSRAGGTGMIWYARDNGYVLMTLAFLALVAVQMWFRRGRPLRTEAGEIASPDPLSASQWSISP